MAYDKRIIAKYTFNNETKYAVLFNYNHIMCQLEKIKNKYIEEKNNNLPQDLVREIDMLTLHKVNFRTAFKETSFCAICGAKEKSLHNHHIRPLKIKKGPLRLLRWGLGAGWAKPYRLDKVPACFASRREGRGFTSPPA
jgi:hypothetical protein